MLIDPEINKVMWEVGCDRCNTYFNWRLGDLWSCPKCLYTVDSIKALKDFYKALGDTI